MNSGHPTSNRRPSAQITGRGVTFGRSQGQAGAGGPPTAAALLGGWLNRGLVWLVVALLALCGTFTTQGADARTVRVLIFSGQSNHNWRETTPVIRAILEADGRFDVEVTEHPEQCEPGEFANHDVVLSNWNTFGEPTVTQWPAPMRAAFLEFVRSGKGFVTVHAGGSSFYDWPEYQQLVGAVWGEGTSHGRLHTNEVRSLAPAHPITAGLEPFELFDEFWQNARVAPGAQPLAEVTPKPEFGGSGKAEPVAFATWLGAGRGFTLLLGHDARAMRSAGFQELLRRGTEWAATGSVTVRTAVPNLPSEP
jgi:type 1 glutamine amidotransferase